MSKYDIFVPAGEKYCAVRIIGDCNGNDVYFAGYDFMGSVDWSDNLAEAEHFDTIGEARDIVNNLESADAPADPVSPSEKEYLLKTVCDGIRQSSIKTGKQIADIYDFDQDAGVYSSMEVYDLDTLTKINLLNLVDPILENKRWMEQEYRDYCENVREYGLDFEGRNL